MPSISLRIHDVEQCEGGSLEYAHLDLRLPVRGQLPLRGLLTAEGTTRRKAAVDVLRALVASGFEAITTEIVLRWVTLGLREYAANPRGEDTWEQKDRIAFLLTIVATLGATDQVRRRFLQLHGRSH